MSDPNGYRDDPEDQYYANTYGQKYVSYGEDSSSSYYGSGYRGRGRGRGRGSSYRGRGSYDHYGYNGSSHSRYGGDRSRRTEYQSNNSYENPEETSVYNDVSGPGAHDSYRGSSYRGLGSLYRGSGYRDGSYRGSRNSIDRNERSDRDREWGSREGERENGRHYSGHHSAYSGGHGGSRALVSVKDKLISGPSSSVRNNSKVKTFNNPWIEIMEINDETTQETLETRYNELGYVNSDIRQLQLAKRKLEGSVLNLERQAEREALHVQITNDKLEEFTYL